MLGHKILVLGTCMNIQTHIFSSRESLSCLGLQHSEQLTHNAVSCNLSVINPTVSNYCVWLLKCKMQLRL